MVPEAVAVEIGPGQTVAQSAAPFKRSAKSAARRQQRARHCRTPSAGRHAHNLLLTLVAALFGYLLMGERLTMAGLAGWALILISLVALNVRTRWQPSMSIGGSRP